MRWLFLFYFAFQALIVSILSIEPSYQATTLLQRIAAGDQLAFGQLMEQYNVQFRYLPTVMEGTVPRYTYVLNEGITNDRQGMMIINNEGILALLA